VWAAASAGTQHLESMPKLFTSLLNFQTRKGDSEEGWKITKLHYAEGKT
jgi:hypothetical protein